MATVIQFMQNILAQKDHLLPNETKRILLKEYLQALTLDYLYNHPLYRRLNFYGGTCLHMIYGLNRLSEDIDLDNTHEVNISTLEADLADYFRARVGVAEISTRHQTGEWGIRRITLKFPILLALGLSAHQNEVLHLKVEVSPQKQVAVIRKTPLIVHGRSFVAAHFSLETMMAGKMIACLERNFVKGASGAPVKGRDFYDLLWFMQQKIKPLEEKLAKDGQKPYTVQSAFTELSEKVNAIKISHLAEDLLPLFERRSFIESWLDGFNDNFAEYVKFYL